MRLTEIEIQEAIEGRQFTAVYQPQYELSSARYCGCEALIRWRHPTLGLISPCEFIPLAEKSGQIAKIGRWMLDKACCAAMAWPSHVRVAVNISPLQFELDDVAQAVDDALGRSGLPASRLEIEITESAPFRDPNAVLWTLDRLREMGVSIAMDDFGTGCSTLGSLRRMPFDKMKIDRSFVTEIASSARAAEMLRRAVSVGRELGIRVCVEGVETARQMAIVTSLRPDEVQGFFFSQPLSEPEVLAALAAGPFRKCAGAAA